MVERDERTPEDRPAGAGDGAADEASFSEQVGAAIRGSRLGQLDPQAAPSAGALLGAMGGVRGLIESLLPGILFLALFTLTKDVAIAVLVPLGVSVAFVLWRVLQKGQPALAFAGLIGVGISAVAALLTGQGEDNFLWGFTVNTIVVLVLIGSMLARRPLVGIVVGALTGKPYAWRTERAKRNVAWRATVLWLAVVGARLAVQVPMYLAADAGTPGAVEALAATKLLMGVPLYLAAMWVTWLMVRAVLDTPDPAAAAPGDAQPR